MMTSFDKSEEQYGLLTEIEGTRNEDERTTPARPLQSCIGRSCQLLILASLTANLLLGTLLLSPLLGPDSADDASRFAHLRRNREEPYVRVTQYSSENETLQDRLWHDIDIDPGVVALPDTWAAQHGLRTAQRFPWDQNKGIYILHGFHNLHCLKIVHIALSEHRRGAPQSRSSGHIDHCMDALRRQILCDADDTPRATDRRAEVVSGLLQHRKCRSWSELEDFARRNTACYKRPEYPEEDGSKLDRFKHCPPGSGYVITDDYVPTDEYLVGLPEESLEDN